MKPLVKLRIKLFLLQGVPFGIIMSGIEMIRGNEFSLWKFLYWALFFGVTMSFCLVSIHKKRLNKIGVKEYTDENLSVIQNRFFRSSLSKDDLIEQVKNDPKFGKMKMIETENGFILKTGVSLKSWGEEIIIVLKSQTNSIFEYQVLSRPKLRTTLIDCGKNLDNVNQFEILMNNIG